MGLLLAGARGLAEQGARANRTTSKGPSWATITANEEIKGTVRDK